MRGSVLGVVLCFDTAHGVSAMNVISGKNDNKQAVGMLLQQMPEMDEKNGED